MKTLYKQYTVVTIMIILLSLTISILLVNSLYNAKVREGMNEKTVGIAQQVRSIAESLPAEQLNNYLTSTAQLGYQLVVLDHEKKPLYYGAPFEEQEISKEMYDIVGSTSIFNGIRTFRQHFSLINHYVNDVQNTIGVPLTVNGHDYAIFIRADNDAAFTEMHYLIVGFLLVSAIIIFIAMIILARQLVKPLKELQQATEQIALENYDIELTIRRDDELGSLARQFNKTAQRLAEIDQLKKDFINNVSHDFQSPLLNIQGYANVLKDGDTTEEERIHYLQIIEQETKRLSALTKQLLLLSSLDQKNLPINKKAFSLDEQLKKVLFAKRWLLDDKQMELVFKLEPLEIFADEHLLEQVWDNLLTNAIRYSNNKGKIIVTCSRIDERIHITFKDKGIGIPEESLDRITERFYRVDHTRSSQSSGLGLAIVSEIIKRHDGELLIESELGEGTLITVKLPLL